MVSLNPAAVSAVQVFGIISGFLLASLGFSLDAYATFRAISTRRLSNYQEIIKSHRELWKLTIDEPEKYVRVLQPDPDLSQSPVTYAERRFVHLVLLHMTSAYYFSKENDLIAIEQMKADIDEFLSHPIPRMVWLDTKHYFNKKFVQFIERHAKPFD